MTALRSSSRYLNILVGLESWILYAAALGQENGAAQVAPGLLSNPGRQLRWHAAILFAGDILKKLYTVYHTQQLRYRTHYLFMSKIIYLQ
jgi:hypothetical protein